MPGKLRLAPYAPSPGWHAFLLLLLLKYCASANQRLALQGYAWEITTPEGGWGLHDVLKARQDKLNGIVNGIDMSEWDPANDPDTAAAYSAEDLSGGVCPMSHSSVL